MREKIQNLNCVLLIDDDEATNFYHTVILEEESSDLFIHAVKSAKEGLDYLLSQGDTDECPKPGIIFLDLNMPGMNGWDFVQKYAELPKEIHEQSVVVLLSTSLNPDDREKAAQLPIVREFVNKPLTPETFWKVVNENFH
jgi:CheY-like chemotaxis protein